MLRPDDPLDLDALSARYRAGELRPTETVAGVLERVAARGDDKVWIHLVPPDQLRTRAAELERRGPRGLPLYGIPFAIKDNIDLAGHPTTAACREFAYVARESAPAVETLLAAGAIAIGKTNMDQFAAGLVGVRSPYGVPGNPFDPRYVPGGSSSGSAVAVATGLVSFALGTDTAGSGRVPAAFNNLVGYKPTRGLVSTRGVVPACRSLDCVSILALTVADAAAVARTACIFDVKDPFARRDPGSASTLPGGLAGCRLGVPRREQLEFFGNPYTAGLFEAALVRLEARGAVRVEIDFAPFRATAQLLYEGPWVAERVASIRAFVERRLDVLHPVTRAIMGLAQQYSATDAFVAHHRLRELARAAEAVWETADVLVTPTAGTIYQIATVEADPIHLNANLGYYTNFMNLLDLSALAVPAGFQPDGLPFGITLAAPPFADRGLFALADEAHRTAVGTMGATGLPLPALGVFPASSPPMARVAVCGAHMSGLPLNHQLTERGARLVRTCRTAPSYRLFALGGFSPARPGMVRAADGVAIAVEVWEMPVERFGGFVASVPPPLAIGTIALEDGGEVQGFLCEAYATKGGRDVSHHGGWRVFLASQ